MAVYQLYRIRFLGDLLHLISFIIIFVKIKTRHSCSGISLKTQILYTLVFLTRYLDIFTNHLSWYLTLMKITFIFSTIYIIYLMKFRYEKTYSKNEDSFPNFVVYLILPCFILALIVNKKFIWKEILWAFSLYLEAVAILPQIWLLVKCESTVESLTTHYIACLGGYRLCYFINWVYRALTEAHYREYIVWISGLVQVLLYGDFFYYYIRSFLERKNMSLPKPA